MTKPRALFPLLACAVLLVACQSPFGTVSYGGGDGSAPQTAVIIQGARDDSVGVRAEYEWIAQHYPGAKRKMQRLSGFAGKPQDIIVITTAAGDEKTLYFDISGFLGKLGY